MDRGSRFHVSFMSLTIVDYIHEVLYKLIISLQLLQKATLQLINQFPFDYAEL